MLGGSDRRTVSALNKVTGGLLLGASAAGGGFALALFDPAAHLSRLSGELVATVREQLDGLGRFDRAERLAAAHAIVVMAAFFEELSAAKLPFDPRRLELSRSDQVRLATGESPPGVRIADLGRVLLRNEVPCPAPQWPYEVTVETIKGFYDGLAHSITRYLRGLVIWDQLDERERQQTAVALKEQAVRATRRYEEMFRRLAIEMPEVAFWANLIDHQATRVEIHRLFVSLTGLGQALEAMAVGRAPDERRLAVARANRAALDRPILPADEAPAGVCIPTLQQSYVNPRFRIADASSSQELASEECWGRQPVRDDLQSFLIGFLTGPQVTDAPLLVLGQPGSGKSALSKVLAARVPPTDFLAVTVPLREVPADADVQTQVEYAVRSATGESVTWPALARSADGALPVLILDGFDELVQATGITQSDYLEKVAAFQRREAEQQRPTAVIVTSRTTVADRARSVSGMVAIRLESFDARQVGQWLAIWNDVNSEQLAARGLRPLPTSEALRHLSLATQPLLLMMLALYDADDNALQGRAGIFAGFELYEGLLRGFAEREVRKTGEAMAEDAFALAVEHELTRLSAVAFAMFNRNRQWATESELSTDLPALLGPGEPTGSAGMRARLTAGQQAVGRFYFVHQAQAIQDGTPLRTYEFLHATFGEYLISRLVIRELDSLADGAQLNAARGRTAPPDDDFLFAMLSFAALTSRTTVIDFLRDGLAGTSAPRSALLKEHLLELFHQSLFDRRSQAYGGYLPRKLEVTGRHAAWSANLALLAVLVGGNVTAKEFFPDSRDGVSWWRQTCLLWRGQLTNEGWNGMVHALDVSREWDNDRRVVRVRIADGDVRVPDLDLNWSYDRAALSAARDGGIAKWQHYSFEDLRRHSHFLCDRVDDTVMHVLEPFGGEIEAVVGTVHALPGGDAVTPARALIDVLLSPNDRLVEMYEKCLTLASHGFLDSTQADATAAERFRAAIHRLLGADQDRLPADWLAVALQRLDLAARIPGTADGGSAPSL
jgi:hypothetical protein